MAEEYDYLFKSIVVGDGGVGKTALTLRFSKGFFTEDYKMTIGVDFHVKTISIESTEGPIKCKLQLWDTGGQERFSSIRPMYYRGSLGAVLVFDLTNYASFEHLPQWIEEVRANIKTEIPLLLVGNKSDLTDQRAVTIEEVNNFTRNFNLYYMETSAKTGDGVGDCFYILACLMIGSEVPGQLIANETVFEPGKITLEGVPIISQTYISEIDYAAPPVPEPPSIETTKITLKAEPEPETDYAAPPVPEPPSPKSYEPAPKYEPEPEITLPDIDEIEFKTPEEILSEKSNELTFDKVTEASGVYKPKVIPFSDAIPTPAPHPKGFSDIDKSIIQEKETQPSTPFRVVKREEPSKPKPASMTFESLSDKIPTSSKENPIFPASRQESSQSLEDYMPQEILSKKKKKKKAKEKKKKEKQQKLQEEREQQEKLIEGLKKTKKGTKETKQELSETPSLFQTLTQRTEEISNEKPAFTPPFIASKKTEPEETSKLRIIPNVTDIENQPSGFMPITPSSSEKQERTPKSQELLICKQCGAILSADYAYCNKCGSRL